MSEYYKVNFGSISTDEISEDLIKDMMDKFPNMSQN